MSERIEVRFRPATPPEDPRVRWRGFQPGASVLTAGSTFTSGGRPLSCDVTLDRDVEIVLRDGARIYADVLRPLTDERLPAVLAWSPYGKQGGYWGWDVYPERAGVAPSATSGLEKFEGPDPAFWCANGYAVVNVDPRGSFASEGDGQCYSPQEDRDGHDVVEWIAGQSWCSEAVVMAGNSWLAAMQWRIAATRPPHLAAIAPWEGFTDAYRDRVLVGGIPRLGLSRAIVEMNAGRGLVEDLAAMAEAFPLMNAYWRTKIADIEAIDVPAYVTASWTNALHTRGTLDAFSRLDPSRSWLRVHNTHEWSDFYAHEQDLLRFFDHVVKGVPNGWEETPRVRLSILDPGGEDEVDRPESAYPVARAQETALFLDATTRRIATHRPAAPGQAEYDSSEGVLVFDHVADHDFEIVGSMKLRLWLEVDAGNDADVFVYVRKADAAGRPVLSRIFSGAVPGAHGRLRASHRTLDPERSTPLAPVHLHEAELPLEPGRPVPLEVAIWPHGMRWHAGERLQVVIAGRSLTPPIGHHAPDPPLRNAGIHRIRTGGSFDTHLLVPICRLKAASSAEAGGD